MERQPGSVTVFHSDDDFAVGSWKNIMLLIYYDNSTLDVVEHTRSALEWLKGRYPKGIGSAVVVTDRAKSMDQSVRKELAKTMEDFASEVKLSMAIFEGSGFKSVIARGVAISLNILARFPFRHLFFNNARKACLWFAKEAVGDWDVSSTDLLDAITEFTHKTKPFHAITVE